MASGMEGLFIGSSAIRTAQNAINTVANNLANVNTDGYVRQQVVQADQQYNRFGTAAVSNQYAGLGVGIGEIVHARDNFVDTAYRQEAGRQSYYEAYYDAINEVESLYQEIEGEAFQETLVGENSLWTAFQTLSEDPSDSVSQNLVVQKASLFLTRADSIYKAFSDYQTQINTQITEDIDRINELGQNIYDLNLKIQRIEAGGSEQAYNMRDERDAYLDELSSLANISYEEDFTGVISLKLEGIQFLDEANFYEVGKRIDKATGYVDAYWPYLSNEQNEHYTYLFDYKRGVSTETNTDIGELKGLIQARGTQVANFANLLGANAEDYYSSTGMSVMEESEAQLDNLVHGITTSINDIYCPNTTASFSVTTTTSDGAVTVTSYKNIKVLDTENCNTGSDRKLPPEELFNRVGCDRYFEVTADDGNTYYIYNEEDTVDATKYTIGTRTFYAWDPEKGNGTIQVTRYNPDGTLRARGEEEPYEQWDNDVDVSKYSKQFIGGTYYYVYNEDYKPDTSTQYTLDSLSVSSALKERISLMPHLKQTGEIDYAMGARLAGAWDSADMQLYPESAAKYNFSDYYTAMTGFIATAGSTYKSTSETLNATCTALDNQRRQTTGVSSDEELTNMIKYQNAYNAASRFVQAVSDMLETYVSLV